MKSRNGWVNIFIRSVDILMDIKEGYEDAWEYLTDGEYKPKRASTQKSNKEYHLDFDKDAKITGLARTRCRELIFPNIERLFGNKVTKNTAVSFAEVLIANLLKNYQIGADKSCYLEFAIDSSSINSLQSRHGMTWVSGHVVRTVVKWLIDNDFVAKTDSKSKLVRGMWELEHSTRFSATDELYNKLNGVLPPNQMKICRGCGEEKSLSEYEKQRDGYETECKVCRSKRRKLARAASKKGY